MCSDSCNLDSDHAEISTNLQGNDFSRNTTDEHRASPGTHATAAKPAINRFVVRLPAGLLEKLKRVSRHHNRSMNAEINCLLARYIDEVKGDTRPRIDEHLKLDTLLLNKLSALPEQKIEALLDLLD